jgi:hypothetical protein
MFYIALPQNVGVFIFYSLNKNKMKMVGALPGLVGTKCCRCWQKEIDYGTVSPVFRKICR